VNGVVRDAIRSVLDVRPLVLDGGLATRLEAQGNGLSTSLWSARLLMNAPDEIAAAHRAFFDAGADVAITASYQASFDGFAGVGIDRAGATELIRRSVDIAFQVAAEYADRRWVAASVGPYGAARADGSEYTGRYGVGSDAMSVDRLRRWHRPRIDVLASAEPDLLAFETIPCLAEAEALLTEVDGSGVDCWLSMSCQADRTRAGEPAREAFAMARDVSEVIAVGVNCTTIDDTARLVTDAAQASGKPVVAYPNSGEGWDSGDKTWTGQTSFDPARVAAWVGDGARIVGGCCRVTADDIAEIADRLHVDR
jgi:homocysteine S-methyltransferase